MKKTVVAWQSNSSKKRKTNTHTFTKSNKSINSTQITAQLVRDNNTNSIKLSKKILEKENDNRGVSHSFYLIRRKRSKRTLWLWIWHRRPSRGGTTIHDWVAHRMPGPVINRPDQRATQIPTMEASSTHPIWVHSIHSKMLAIEDTTPLDTHHMVFTDFFLSKHIFSMLQYN